MLGPNANAFSVYLFGSVYSRGAVYPLLLLRTRIVNAATLWFLLWTAEAAGSLYAVCLRPRRFSSCDVLTLNS